MLKLPEFTHHITSHHDMYLPNTETLSYIVWLGKMNYIQKSRFQITKKVKMKILKVSMETDESFKILIRQVCSIAHLF